MSQPAVRTTMLAPSVTRFFDGAPKQPFIDGRWKVAFTGSTAVGKLIQRASPFGGYRQSGIGRELGRHALDLFAPIKQVWLRV
jgi:acyl-CoA reductase-like NAD-dependent aldehyde dehydrogenase